MENENRQKVFELIRGVFPDAKLEGVQISLGSILFTPIVKRDLAGSTELKGIQIGSYYRWTPALRVMLKDGQIDVAKLKEKVEQINQVIREQHDEWKKTKADKELIEPELQEVESRFPALSRVLSEAEEDLEQTDEV